MIINKLIKIINCVNECRIIQLTRLIVPENGFVVISNTNEVVHSSIKHSPNFDFRKTDRFIEITKYRVIHFMWFIYYVLSFCFGFHSMLSEFLILNLDNYCNKMVKFLLRMQKKNKHWWRPSFEIQKLFSISLRFKTTIVNFSTSFWSHFTIL